MERGLIEGRRGVVSTDDTQFRVCTKNKVPAPALLVIGMEMWTNH